MRRAIAVALLLAVPVAGVLDLPGITGDAPVASLLLDEPTRGDLAAEHHQDRLDDRQVDDLPVP